MRRQSLNEFEVEQMCYELEKVKTDLNIALDNFNSAPMELVDYYSYRIKSLEAKYDYLLRQTKDMNLSNYN